MKLDTKLRLCIALVDFTQQNGTPAAGDTKRQQELAGTTVRWDRKYLPACCRPLLILVAELVDATLKCVISRCTGKLPVGCNKPSECSFV